MCRCRARWCGRAAGSDSRGGERDSSAVYFWKCPGPLESISADAIAATGIQSDDQLKSTLSAGQKNKLYYSKAATTNPVANNFYDLWPVGGNPVSGTYGGVALAAVTYSETSTGALNFGASVQPTYIRQFVWGYCSSTAGTPTFEFYVRIGSYDNCAFVVGSQSFTGNPGGGVSPFSLYVGSGQPGGQIMVTGQTVGNATANNISVLHYTNQAGTAGQLIPGTPATIVSPAAPTASLGARIIAPSVTGATVPTAQYVALATGDTGARALEDFTCTGANTGRISFVLVWPLVLLPTATAGIGVYVEFVNMVGSLEQIFDSSCISALAFFPTANGATIQKRAEAVYS